MRAPEITYGYTAPTDTAGPTFELFTRNESISGGASALSVLTFGDIPKDRILVLSNVALTADPGNAQFIDEMRIQGITQAGLIFDIATDIVVKAANIEASLNWDGAVYIQGGGLGNDSIRVLASFDAFANANLLAVGLHGVVIPHGNVASF